MFSTGHGVVLVVLQYCYFVGWGVQMPRFESRYYEEQRFKMQYLPNKRTKRKKLGTQTSGSSYNYLRHHIHGRVYVALSSTDYPFNMLILYQVSRR